MALRLIRSLVGGFNQASQDQPPQDTGAAVDLAMMFDTTGSMYCYLKKVRSKLRQIAGDVARSHSDNYIGVIAFGDYCDRNRPYVVTHHPLSGDLAAVQRFVEKVDRTGGGDFPEAVEEALHAANALKWRENCPRVAVLVGDAPPHGVIDSRSKCEYGHFYIDEAKDLKQKGVVVYTVQCGGAPQTTESFTEIAHITGGKHLMLEQIDDLPELIVAACKHRTGDLKGYGAELEKEGRVTGRLKRQLATLDD
jgi:Mg-chelatase subunit ChlD